MKVKSIITRALKYVGRDDLAKALDADETLTSEGAEKVETLLYCFNAVEDELARYYFPLVFCEEFASEDGNYAIENFSHRPVKILSVKSDGKAVKFTPQPKFIRAEAQKITVRYEYSPSAKRIDGESAFTDCVVGESLVAAGVASEYCLIEGSMQDSQLWESRYRWEIDLAQKKYSAPHGTIPPRRWV
ncbi:MAG: hypothetical protein HDP34_04185 [Clostridia bacterium]|nr:hypothetical protein [Clostridia bacterium]